MSDRKVIEEQQDWIHAVDLLSEWEKGTQHADDLLEALDPGRLRWLVMEVFRQWLLIEGVLRKRVLGQLRSVRQKLTPERFSRCRQQP